MIKIDYNQYLCNTIIEMMGQNRSLLTMTIISTDYEKKSSKIFYYSISVTIII